MLTDAQMNKWKHGQKVGLLYPVKPMKAFEDNLDVKFSLFLHKTKCCGYSLESPDQGSSNEQPQHMFLWRSKENYPSNIIKYPPCLFYCISCHAEATKGGNM